MSTTSRRNRSTAAGSGDTIFTWLTRSTGSSSTATFSTARGGDDRFPMVTAPPVPDVDLTAHDLYRGGFPHELFRELRDEHPVWRHPHTKLKRAPEGMEFWVVLGHPELQALARD